MRRLILFTTVVWLGVSTAQAQTQVLLADANKDGKVTSTEYQNSRRTFLMRGDRNKDGKISADEWKRGAQIVQAEVRDAGVQGAGLIGKANFFTALDADKDGFVTPGEIDALSARRFAAFDPNHDGVVTTKEAREIERKVGKP